MFKSELEVSPVIGLNVIVAGIKRVKEIRKTIAKICKTYKYGRENLERPFKDFVEFNYGQGTEQVATVIVEMDPR